MEANLYKVLLVDDEEDVRSSIVKKLDWASLGFEMAGEAANGEEALEMAERLLPDVIMTDIKMPFMDGLELCRRVRALLPGVRIAIFSGFDEFEYAKEAIANQVQEYILKPIDAEELAEVFRRLRKSLDEEIAQRRDVQRLRKYYEESLPLMRQQVLLDLLEGRTGFEGADDRAVDYGVDIDAEGYCVAVVRSMPQEAGRDEQDDLLMDYSLRQLVEDTLRGTLRHYTIQMPRATVLLFLLDKDTGAKQVVGLLGQLFPVCRKLLGLRLSIGVGGCYAQPGKIEASYSEARSALEYQILMEPGQCIYIGDIVPDAAPEQALNPAYAEAVLRQIKVGHTADLESAVMELMHQLKNGTRDIRVYQEAAMELSTDLLKLARSYKLDADEARLDELLNGGLLQQFTNLEDLGRWLLGFCDNLRQLVRRERKDTARLLVDRAKEILAQRYAESDLSLEAVSAELNVSSAYFSTLFKKETGQGFVSYLTALRMEKALELLAGTDDKTYQIAEQVGYTDANYFSYVFKRQFGMAPFKYKQDRIADDGEAKKMAGEA